MATVLADRGKYIAAAMTIVRAFLCSGQKDPKPPLASFEEWSHMVRSPLIWLGKADPADAIEAARAEDQETLTLEAVMSEWEKATGLDNPLTTGELKKVSDKTEHSEFRQALLDAAEWKGEVDAKRLGRFLGRYQGRIVNGVKLVAPDDKHIKQKRWALKQVRPR